MRVTQSSVHPLWRTRTPAPGGLCGPALGHDQARCFDGVADRQRFVHRPVMGGITQHRWPVCIASIPGNPVLDVSPGVSPCTSDSGRYPHVQSGGLCPLIFRDDERKWSGQWTWTLRSFDIPSGGQSPPYKTRLSGAQHHVPNARAPARFKKGESTMRQSLLMNWGWMSAIVSLYASPVFADGY